MLRYQGKINWKKLTHQLPNSANLRNSGLWKEMLCEIGINFIFPLPWNVHKRVYFSCEVLGFSKSDVLFYHINELLTFIMTFRFLLIFRYLVSNTKWLTNRTNRVCRMFDSNSD